MITNIVDFTALQIKLASPEDILEWSNGEVKEPETINYRSLKPEKDGLFDEKIFGPVKDYECHCGKYKRRRFKGIICDKCGVEVTHSSVRRERMGHIELAAPVAHVWYFKGAPSKLSRLLDISPRDITSVMYFSQYVVLSVDEGARASIVDNLDIEKVKDEENLRQTAKENIEQIKEKLFDDQKKLKEKLANKEETLQIKLDDLDLRAKRKIVEVKQDLQKEIERNDEIYDAIKSMVKRIKKRSVLTEDEYIKLIDYHAEGFLEVGMGAESILRLVEEIDLETLEDELRKKIEESTSVVRTSNYTKRLKVVEGLRQARIDPKWMFINVVPVIPPDLRPMVQLSGGRFASSDLNDLYRRVINRNNRLRHLINLGAPEIILRNEKRMLQEAVDSLIDSKVTRNTRSNRVPLKSLSDMLKGKKGRFRRNLLGKRVDYSGRSVIIVGPELRLNECGLPKDMALEMFKPYVFHELILQGIAPNVKSARNLVDRREPEVYDVLEKVTKNHPVLLNRAPTLHKLGILAFYPKLIDGRAIKIHPCVCAGYNADFDGDQMAVHLPLTEGAKKEAIELMMATKNLLKPANSQPITVPNKEMVMGVYYYTILDSEIDEHPNVFADVDEATHAYQIGLIDLRQPIRVRVTRNNKSKVITTTLGRLEFNNILPEEMEFINQSIDSEKVKDIIAQAIEDYDEEVVSHIIDDIKDLGFKAATTSGVSVSVTDCHLLDSKDQIIEQANKKSEKVHENYQQGLITNKERRKKNFDIWMETTEEVADKTWKSYEEKNALKVIIRSGGTRASKDQVKQLAAMRGLVVDPLGNIVEMPTKSNFREGLSIFEYVNSARGSRKGLTDSALKTANAGYLTRRLVDVSHDLIIREEDCGTTEGIVISKKKRRESFVKRVAGRFALEDIKIGNKVIAKQGEVITPQQAEMIDQEEKISEVKVRSPLTCQSRKGLCVHCYGRDFSSRKLVSIGTPVGVIAAQSIGEPGTQLTMRTKHSAGIVGLDVTQGLPRVEELFEVRNPKSKAIITTIAGKVSLGEQDGEKVVEVRSTTDDEVQIYSLPVNAKLAVEDKELVHAGQQLTLGSIDHSELLKVRGLLVTQLDIVHEAQAVYESQGIGINDRHFEVIVRKMGDKLRITDVGDTNLLMGEVISRSALLETNEDVMAAGGEPASAEVLLLGITRSALFTDSWLSAASFQHTKQVLTDAASVGKIDYLEGLKENVIIGRLIPTTSERLGLIGEKDDPADDDDNLENNPPTEVIEVEDFGAELNAIEN
ncbi:MAG: DNA-directed RNA polymerase subunit beta' [Microgenomates bacterium 39_7]|nr:MAG: DNA-directed RNA polymerase subunit beta' [Microgenomates bacterium 39_7]